MFQSIFIVTIVQSLLILRSLTKPVERERQNHQTHITMGGFCVCVRQVKYRIYNTFQSHTLHNPRSLLDKNLFIIFTIRIRLYYSDQGIYHIQNTLFDTKVLNVFVVRFYSEKQN